MPFRVIGDRQKYDLGLFRNVEWPMAGAFSSPNPSKP